MKRDSGFVLVNALIIVAAVSALSLAVLRDVEGGIARAGAASAAQRADTGLVAGRLLAARLLAEDHAAGETDHRGERWDLTNYRTELDDGATVHLSVEDLQGRFNINLLLGEDAAPAEAVFRRLADAAGAGPGTTDAILSRYAARRSAQGEVPAPLPDGTFFRDEALALTEEIRQIPGAGSAADDLGLLVSTLPQEAGVNVGTAGPEVMAAIIGVEDPVAWAEFAARRRDGPFETIDDALGAIAVAWGEAGAAAALTQNLLVLQSEWFEARARSETAAELAAARFVLFRGEADGAVAVVMRVPEEP